MNAIDRLFSKLRVLLFLAAITLPLLGTWLQWDPWPGLNENRRLAAFPDPPHTLSQAATYLPGLFSFYRDHFGFRNSLIHQLMKIQVGLFRVSAVPEVIVGQDDWLFIRLKDDPNSPQLAPPAPLSDSQLDQWQQAMESRRAWLAARHIGYLVVIAPEKQSIYPEYLPPRWRALQYDPRIDQLVNRLKSTHSPVPLLDLRSDLLDAKREEPVYWKADTHWTPYGDYIVYRAIMNEVARIVPNKPLPIWQRQDLRRFQAKGNGGDLANMLGVPELYNQEINVIAPPPQKLPPRDQTQQIFITIGNPASPRLIMYHDSFGYRLIPLMAKSFSDGVFVWGKHDLYPDFLAAHHPDLIIDEFAERILADPASDTFRLPRGD